MSIGVKNLKNQSQAEKDALIGVVQHDIIYVPILWRDILDTFD